MKRVYAGTDPIRCGWLASVLEGAGIDCVLRNQYLGGAIGELPLNEAWPEIWVVDAADHARARALVDDALAAKPFGHPWICPACDEHIEGQFGACWQCGASRP